MSKIRSCMIVGLMSLQLYGVSSVDAAEKFVPGQSAIQQLHSLNGQYVRVVLADQTGVSTVIHARVNPRLTRKDVIYFDQFVKRLPEAEMTLIEKFVSEELEYPITSEIGQLTVRRLNEGPRVREIRAAGQTVESGKDQYLVQSIERLHLTGPDVTSRFIMTSRTVPESDLWVGHRAGQNSNRKLVYRLVDSDKEYQFRIPWNEQPNFFKISSIEISQPGYFYYSENKYERGIEFFVTYVGNDNGKHRRTDRGVVELDVEGYPTRGHFARAPFLDQSLFAEVAQAKEASKPPEPAFAGKLPTELRRNDHDGGSLPRSSKLSQGKEMVKNVVGPTELKPLSEQQTAYARADIRAYVRDIRNRLLFSRSVVEYLAVATDGNFEFLQGGAARGWPEGLFVVSFCRFYGIQCEKNEEQAINDLTPLAQQQNINAVLGLACMKLERSYRNKDLNEEKLAIKLLHSLAERKDPVGITMLAQCYQYGDGGVTKDTEKAFELWELAAEQDAPLGLYMMGIQADERGKKHDATQWFKRAAHEGHTLGMFTFGERCYFGIGWGKDYDAAFYWYQKAASEGLVNAQVAVSNCYELGTGVDRDWDIARTWREAAMKQGSLVARRKAAIAEIDHAMHHFLTVETVSEEADLKHAIAHYKMLQSESGPEAQQEFKRLQRVFKNVMTKALGYAEDKGSIPIPIPRPSEDELEDVRLRHRISFSALMADSLELQNSIYEGRPGARAVRMAQQDQELSGLLAEFPKGTRRIKAVQKFDRSGAANRFSKLWAEPLAKAIYGTESPEYQRIAERCRVIQLD